MVAHDLENFTLFLSRALRISPILKVPEALRFFFRQSSPSAHEIVICWRNCMVGSGLAPASVSRQIATLRSLTKLARMLGMCTWSVELPGVRIERRRP